MPGSPESVFAEDCDMSEDRPDELKDRWKKQPRQENTPKKQEPGGARSGRARRRTIGDNPMGLH